MISSTFKVISCLFVVCLIVHTQNPAQKTRTASISGKVTHKGKGIEGILVSARVAQSSRGEVAVVAATDQDGNYRMSNVAPGQYEVAPAAPQYVLAGFDPMKRLLIGEGETVENVDFALVRGGVITGKVTDAEGRPLIEEPVQVFGPEGPNREPAIQMSFMLNVTDDRGVYRIYGLAPGKYRVAAGSSEDQMYHGRERTAYTRTYYPSTNESDKPTLIEVTEGGEARDVDITLRRLLSLFTVTARVVDAETGQPIPEARYGIERFRENGGSSTSGRLANKLGEIRIENIPPGKYALFLDSLPTRDLFAEPVRFEVVDQDIKGLLIRATSGSSSISGVVVFEGVDEKVASAKLNGLLILARIMDERSIGGGTAPAIVSRDGSFRIFGLRPGVVSFSTWNQFSGPAREFEVARVERDGVAQPTIEIKAREQIKGVRLIVRPLTGRIRGVLKFENGQLPISNVQVSAKKVNDENYETPLPLDDRGRFMSEPLGAGLYELRVVAYVGRRRPAQIRQQVVVGDNEVSEVTLTLDLKADNGQGRP